MKFVFALVLACSLACTTAGNRAPILVAQSGLAVSQSISQVSTAAEQLQKASVLPAAANLRVQETLLAINGKLKPLPDLLRTIDAAQKAGQSGGTTVDQAIGILQVVSTDLSGVLAGVPVAETTKALIELVRAAQTTVTNVLVEVARIKGA